MRRHPYSADMNPFASSADGRQHRGIPVRPRRRNHEIELEDPRFNETGVGDRGRVAPDGDGR